MLVKIKHVRYSEVSGKEHPSANNLTKVFMVANIKRAGGKNKFRGSKEGLPSNGLEMGGNEQDDLSMHEGDVEVAEMEGVTATFDVQPTDVVGAVEAVEALLEEPSDVAPTTVVEEFELVYQEQPTKVARFTETLMQARQPVTATSAVRALEEAFGFGKSMLRLEVAVALAMFASSDTGASLATKRSVMEVYAKAGFQTSPGGSDYKTVSRRVGASVDLFNMLGKNAVLEAMQGLRENKAIKALTHHLGQSYQFDSINSLLEFVGKPVAQTNTAEAQARRAAKLLQETATSISVDGRIEARRAERQKQIAEESDGILMFAGPLSMLLPRDCTPADIRGMIAKLTEFADRLEAEIGTPEEQRNREMHS